MQFFIAVLLASFVLACATTQEEKDTVTVYGGKGKFVEVSKAELEANKLKRVWWDGKAWTKTDEPPEQVEAKAKAGDPIYEFNFGNWHQEEPKFRKAGIKGIENAAGIPKDDRIATQWLCKAADKRMVMALAQLASIAQRHGVPTHRAREGLGNMYGCAPLPESF
jgi:TPR repeat protein